MLFNVRKLNFLTDFLFFLISVVSCSLLHRFSLLSTVMASITVGLTLSFIPQLFKHYSKERQCAIIYCGSFIGMSSFDYSYTFSFYVGSSFMAVMLFNFFEKFFIGFGGKLGTLAFFTVGILMMGEKWF